MSLIRARDGRPELQEKGRRGYVDRSNNSPIPIDMYDFFDISAKVLIDEKIDRWIDR